MDTRLCTSIGKVYTRRSKRQIYNYCWPQGGTSLNGDALKAEAQVELDKLDEELRNYVDGSDPLSFIIG